MKIATKYFLYLNAILALISLAVPFVWLEIGPLGKQYYGPNMPDIYILGATILGKDKSFWGINFAYKFQLFTILYFSISSLWTVCILEKRKLALSLTIINLLLLALFPLWLYYYVGVVLNNSDGASADMSIHWHIGLLIYFAIFTSKLIIISRIFRSYGKLKIRN
jgi:hypothetical protein